MIPSVARTELMLRTLPPRPPAIIARTDGIPLYLEEVTSAVLDGATGPDTVPATLRESLAARLDRLGPARETAQIAAGIGREVDIDLLGEEKTAHNLEGSLGLTVFF